MSEKFVTEEDIYAASNDGFDIIVSLYPDAADCLRNPKKKFKRRDEKTASAKVNKTRTESGENLYIIYDFGSKESIGPIKAYMEERRVDWVTAINELARQYNVKVEQVKKAEAIFSIRAATADEVDGSVTWEKKNSFDDFEIEQLFSSQVLWHLGFYNNLADPEAKKKKKDAAYNRLRSVLQYYNHFALKSFTRIKNGKAMTFASHSKYPIYLIDETTHQKIYQPKAEKEWRFSYAGTLPKDFLHGLTQLTRDYNKRKAEIEAGEEESKENVDRGQDATPGKVKLKIPKLIIVSGGSDAMNAAALGYQVLWPNSESAKITPEQWKDLTFKADKIYQLMDIDATGIKQAHERALEYLDLHTIELPTELLTKRDNRGYQRKDLRDFLDLYKPKEFDKLVDVALPYRFWDEKYKYNKQGEFVGIDYDFNNVHAYNFMQRVGFFRLPVGSQVSDFLYIKITGNIVEETTPINIKDYIKHFLRRRNADVALRNAIFRTTQLSENSLTNLDRIELEFKDYTPKSQFMFFKNKTIEVNGSGIIQTDPGSSTRFVWEREVHDHFFKLIETPSFTITKDNAGAYDIEINNYECQFLRYLIQVSRVHWRTELETNLDEADMTPIKKKDYQEKYRYHIDGPLLSVEEIEEQKKHLINKIFAIGYLMHRYKYGPRSWMVLGMDAKISTDGKSHGGSGKSLLYSVAMNILLKSTFQLSGRASKLDQNDHKYDGLTEHHRYIFIEDAHQYLPYDIFYTDITGNVAVNPKGKTPYIIPFDKAGKHTLTTNYTPTNLSPSTERRLLYTAFSDYYHDKGATSDYREQRDPSTEFGMQMFGDWDEKLWNQFYNTAVQCLRFYLSTDVSEKLQPAMDNVNARNLISVMGPNFFDWASVYFSEESDKLDIFIVRHEVFRDYEYHNPSSKLTPHSWLDKLRAFCRYMGYDLNPIEYQDKRGSIIQKVDKKQYDARNNTWTAVEGEKGAKEMIFVRTPAFLEKQEAENRKETAAPIQTSIPMVSNPDPEEKEEPF